MLPITSFKREILSLVLDPDAIDYFIFEHCSPFFIRLYSRVLCTRCASKARMCKRDADGAAIITGLMRER